MKIHKILLKATICTAILSTSALAGGSVGGNCCADLEERVAELEATSARKGNRRVSLTIYGQVNKAIILSDELKVGQGDDIAIVDNGNSPSRFGLKGKAKISADLYAGYRIEFGVGSSLSIRHNDLFIGSKTLGKLSIGQGSTASDGIAEIDLSGTKIANGALNRGGAYTIGYKFDHLDGDSRAERIRYDTPTLAGFKLSTSWQDNGDYDIALRYGGKWGDFAIAAGVAYLNEDAATDYDLGGQGVLIAVPLANVEEETISGSFSMLHVPSGFNLTFAAGRQELGGDELRSYWYVKAGVKRKIFSSGVTSFSVDYQKEKVVLGVVETDKVGFQLVQKIDAAAMEIYLSGWSTESDLLLDEDVIMVGTRIRF